MLEVEIGLKNVEYTLREGDGLELHVAQRRGLRHPMPR